MLNFYKLSLTHLKFGILYLWKGVDGRTHPKYNDYSFLLACDGCIKIKCGENKSSLEL